MSSRIDFLSYIEKGLPRFEHALLKFSYSSVLDLPENSDIDVLIRDRDRRSLSRWLSEGPGISRFAIHEKSYVSFVHILFDDDSYLEIDLITAFDRKGLIYLDAVEVMFGAQPWYGGLRKASIQHDFEYMLLFHLANGQSPSAKHRSFFSSLDTEKRRAIFSHLCTKYKLTNQVIEELYEPGSRHWRKIQRGIRLLAANRWYTKPKRIWVYLKDLTMDLRYNRGIMITVSGVDGAGKSTVLQHIQDTLQSRYRQKTVLLRHRPGIIPILSSFKYGKKNAEKRAAQNLPRQGTNKSKPASLLRFAWYLLDYLLGQIYVWFRYTLRGYTVLYDRYYFDYIIDPKRSNITLPTWLLKACYSCIVKPRLNFFLYASPELILQRKKELNTSEIVELSAGYRRLFDELSARSNKEKYLAINNIDLNITLRYVTKACISATF